MSLVGARPFDDREEVAVLLSAINGRWKWRDRALVTCGCRTGLRVSELLSWTIGDVCDGGKFRESVYTKRSRIKGKREGRRLPLHPEARRALARWLVDLRRHGLELDSNRPVFSGREGGFTKAISRKSAHRIVSEAATRAKIQTGISTHSWRKLIAVEIYQKSGNCLIKTGAVLGHRQVATTWRYCRSVAIGAEDLLLD